MVAPMTTPGDAARGMIFTSLASSPALTHVSDHMALEIVGAGLSLVDGVEGGVRRSGALVDTSVRVGG